jgi:hypothetical protein
VRTDSGAGDLERRGCAEGARCLHVRQCVEEGRWAVEVRRNPVTAVVGQQGIEPDVDLAAEMCGDDRFRQGPVLTPGSVAPASPTGADSRNPSGASGAAVLPAGGVDAWRQANISGRTRPCCGSQTGRGPAPAGARTIPTGLHPARTPRQVTAAAAGAVARSPRADAPRSPAGPRAPGRGPARPGSQRPDGRREHHAVMMARTHRR